MHDPKEIAKIINAARDALDKSCFGPLFQYPDHNDITKRQVNQLAFSVYTFVLSAMLNSELKRKE